MAKEKTNGLFEKIADSDVFNTGLSAIVFGTVATAINMFHSNKLSLGEVSALLIVLMLSYAVFAYSIKSDGDHKELVKGIRDFILNVVFALGVSTMYGEVIISPKEGLIIVISLYFAFFSSIYIRRGSIAEVIIVLGMTSL